MARFIVRTDAACETFADRVPAMNAYSREVKAGHRVHLEGPGGLAHSWAPRTYLPTALPLADYAGAPAAIFDRVA